MSRRDYRRRAFEYLARANATEDPEERDELLRFAAMWMQLFEPMGDIPSHFELPKVAFDDHDFAPNKDNDLATAHSSNSPEPTTMAIDPAVLPLQGIRQQAEECVAFSYKLEDPRAQIVLLRLARLWMSLAQFMRRQSSPASQSR